MELTPISVDEYPALVQLWEASVRATHDFLRLEDLQFYKECLLVYLPAVQLVAARDELGRIVAFLGTHGESIEMLFVDPALRGMGVGRALVHHAVEVLHCNRVDVNEQNKQAVGFYERMGFRVASRSAIDAEGKPYPILHLTLEPALVAGLRNNP